MSDGDLDGLVELLAADVVVYGDGGGKAPQWTRPIVGADHVARLLLGLGRQVREHGRAVELHEVNGQPGAMSWTPTGELISVLSLEIVDGRCGGPLGDQPGQAAPPRAGRRRAGGAP